MSTAVATADRAAAAPRGKVTQAHVLRSEWTKLFTLRSTRWSLLAASCPWPAWASSSRRCR